MISKPTGRYKTIASKGLVLRWSFTTLAVNKVKHYFHREDELSLFVKQESIVEAISSKIANAVWNVEKFPIPNKMYICSTCGFKSFRH